MEECELEQPGTGASRGHGQISGRAVAAAGSGQGRGTSRGVSRIAIIFMIVAFFP
jgi:hypothetical protein